MHLHAKVEENWSETRFEAVSNVIGKKFLVNTLPGMTEMSCGRVVEH